MYSFQTVIIRRLALALILVLAGVSLWPGAVSAQQPGAAVTINQLDASKYPQLSAVVTVLDARQLPVPALTDAQFEAFDGEQATPITTVRSAQDESLRLSVIVVIDVSGSMATSFSSAQQAASQFVTSLRANDEAAIVAFNDKVTVAAPLTADKRALTDTISRLQPGGGTALFEAVQTGAFLAREANTPRAAVVLLTDGENDTTASSSTEADSLSSVRSAGIPLFTIGYGAAPDVRYLQSISTATQGDYRAATSASVVAVYDNIAALLRNQYVLTMTATAPANGDDATLRIVANVGGSAASAEAAFKRGAAPVSAAPTAAATAAGTSDDDEPAATSSGGSNFALLAIGAIVGLAAVAAIILVAEAWLRRRRAHGRQLAVVKPNPALAAALGVPPPVPGVAASADNGTGRLIELNGATPAHTYTFASAPISIGSEEACDVHVPRRADIAARHALVWIKDGKIILRHVGGPRRPTLIGGRPVQWVTLDEGDEFTVGPHRYRAERLHEVPNPPD